MTELTPTHTGVRHIIAAQQYSTLLLEHLFERGLKFSADLDHFRHRKHGHVPAGHILFNIFVEPSTRTRFSFARAAHLLGMTVLESESAKEFSSYAKGESMHDMIQTLSQYQPDIIVLRHDETNAMDDLAATSPVPLINAGDGRGQHPTQALTDLFTIQQRLGRTRDLHIIIGGDLANGRTARSLAYLLGKFPGNHITFVSPSQLVIGRDITTYLDHHDVSYTETDDLHAALPAANVVYWTRVQTERLTTEQQGAQRYIIDLPEVQLLRHDAIILHPLPRVTEITRAVDATPQAAYFQQVRNGMIIRMALIEWILGYN